MSRSKGSKNHYPTPETRAEVHALRSFGVSAPEMAKHLGISQRTLEKHYKPELRSAHIAANAKVASFALYAASGEALKDGASFGDCLRSAHFWLRTRAGWRETDKPDDQQANAITIEWREND